MIVQESDLVVGKWYIVVKVRGTGKDSYQAISAPFDLYYEACHKASGADYPDDAEIRYWGGKGWSAVRT